MIFLVILILPSSAYFLVKNQKVQTYLVHQITDFFSRKLDAKFTVESVDYTLFNKIILNNVYIEDQQGDSLIKSKKISGNLRSLNLKDRELFFKKLELDTARIRIYNDTSKNINLKFLVDALKRKDTTKPRMHLKFTDLKIKNSHLEYTTNKPADKGYGVDLNQIKLNNFDLSVNKMEADSGWANFHINNLAFDDKSGFRVIDMKSDVFIGRKKVQLNGLELQTPFSYLNANKLLFNHNGFQNFKEFIDKVGFSMDIKRSNVAFNDLAYFSEIFHGIPSTNVAFEGKLDGKVKNIRGKDVYLALGRETELKTDFSADGLPDIGNTFLYIDIDQLNTSLEDLNIINHFTKQQKSFNIPKWSENLGLISYRGNFTGFTEDFVAYGTLQTNLGQLSTDISLKPKEKKELNINGNVKTSNFDVSGLMNNNENFGALSMDIQINGSVIRNQGFKTYTDGIIEKLEINNYDYKNIKLDGLLTDKKYDGALTIEDPNIQFEFSGGIDFSQQVPVFNFKANLYEAKLNKLNFVDEEDTTARLALNLNSNFQGYNLDNAQGIIQFNKGRLIKDGKHLNFDNLKIDAKHTNDTHRIFLNSDYIDGSLIGKYKSTSVHQSLKNLMFSYLPVFIKKETDTATVEVKNNFELNINLKDTKKITDIFFPKLNISRNANLNMTYEGADNSFSMKAKADNLNYKYYHFYDVHLESYSQDSLFSLITGFDNLKFNPKENTTYLNNYSLKSLTGNNKSKILIEWNDPDQNSSKGEFIALVNFMKQQNTKNIISKIFFLPGILNLQGEDWHFAKSSITIDSSSISFDNIKFQHEHQKFAANGKIAKDPKDTLKMNFSDIDLSYANVLFPSRKVILEGIINGNANLSDIYGKPTFESNLAIDTLTFNNQKLGHTFFYSRWNPVKQNIWFDAESKRNNLKTIDFEGEYTPKSQTLDFDLTLDKLRLDFLNPIIQKNFSDVKGVVSGFLNLQGTTENPVFNGKLITQKSAFTINYLNTRYNFTKIINVSDNRLIFDNTVVYDKYGNKSNLNGTLHFKKLKSLYYDFNINASEFLALNTTGADNSTYYGEGFASGLVNIQGNTIDEELIINATANTEENTKINLPIGSSSETKKTQFITFINEDSEKKKVIKEYAADLSWIDLNFDLEITPLAETRLIFDPALGDMINARGRGNINMKVDQNGEFRIHGDYIIEDGDYMFSLKNVINKKFEIQQGSQIVWNGKPQEADINVTAIYRLRTSLNNLLMDTTEFYNKRIPVECKILLTDNLSNPSIDFEIDLPTADESTRARVQGAISTDEELNKQFLSLIVLNTFMPAQQYLAGQSDPFDMGSTSMAFTTSELLSNQLSHWLSQISNNWDVGINYQPGDEISRDQVEVALSTQLLNDRLIINGNVGTGSKYAQTSEVVGDFRVDWKLSKNGKLRLKFFNRNSDKLIYEETRYIQGAGLYYREDFNNFEELIKNNKKNQSNN